MSKFYFLTRIRIPTLLGNKQGSSWTPVSGFPKANPDLGAYSILNAKCLNPMICYGFSCQFLYLSKLAMLRIQERKYGPPEIYRVLVGSLEMNTALEYSTRVVQEGDRRCKKSTLNDLAYLTPLRIPLMNPVFVFSREVLYRVQKM
jgi:hypothetical protein